jgi:hypothetical protein
MDHELEDANPGASGTNWEILRSSHVAGFWIVWCVLLMFVIVCISRLDANPGASGTKWGHIEIVTRRWLWDCLFGVFC